MRKIIVPIIILTSIILIVALIGSKITGLQIDPIDNNETGLVALWHLNEGSGTMISDSSGNGNTGTISGATWIDGKFGKALQFNGIDNYVTVSDKNSLDITNELTLEAWIKTNSIAVWGSTILEKQFNQYRLDIPSDGKYRLIILFNTAGEKALSSNLIVKDGNWHHLVGVYDGTYMRTYVDGVSRTSLLVSDTISTSANPLLIGAHKEDETQSMFNGTLDEIAVYNRALSASEILNHYNKGMGGGGDTTSPTVSVSHSPLSPNTTTSVTLTATASDNVGVTGINIYVDGASKKTCTSSPCSTTAQTYSLGNHTYYATASDAAGNSGRDPSSGTKSFTVTTQAAVCGNNVKETGEDCDGTDSSSCPGQCTAGCTCPMPTGNLTWLHTDGKYVKNEYGQTIFLRGAAYPGPNEVYPQELHFSWLPEGVDSFYYGSDKKANLLRLPLTQWKYWGPYFDGTDPNAINLLNNGADEMVNLSAERGFYIVIDFHGSRTRDASPYPQPYGDYPLLGKDPTPYINWMVHWAERYKDRPNVIYELWNEPWIEALGNGSLELGRQRWISIVNQVAANITAVNPKALMIVNIDDIDVTKYWESNPLPYNVIYGWGFYYKLMDYGWFREPYANGNYELGFERLRDTFGIRDRRINSALPQIVKEWGIGYEDCGLPNCEPARDVFLMHFLELLQEYNIHSDYWLYYPNNVVGKYDWEDWDWTADYGKILTSYMWDGRPPIDPSTLDNVYETPSFIYGPENTNKQLKNNGQPYIIQETQSYPAYVRITSLSFVNNNLDVNVLGPVHTISTIQLKISTGALGEPKSINGATKIAYSNNILTVQIYYPTCTEFKNCQGEKNVTLNWETSTPPPTPPSCTESWTCGAWSNCVGGTQTRTCIDENVCGTTNDKPATSQSCQSCVESWLCSEWSNCTDSLQTRTCTDSNVCGTTLLKPQENQTCEMPSLPQQIIENIVGSEASVGPSGTMGGTSFGGSMGGSIVSSPKAQKVNYKFNLPIYEVSFMTLVNLTSSKVSIEDLGNIKPQTISLIPDGLIYKYARITTSNIDDKNNQDIKIKFKVPLPFYKDNGIDSRKTNLQKWDGNKWNKLDTIQIGSDSTTYYFESSSSSLSLFAITAEITGILTPSTTCNNFCNEGEALNVDTCTCSAIGYNLKGLLSPKNLPYTAVAIVIIGIIILFVFLRRR